MRGSGRPMLALGSGAARFMSNLQAGGLTQRADQGALAKLDLELVVLARLGLGEGPVRGDSRRLVVKLFAFQMGFRFLRAPRHRRDATERNSRLPDRVAVEIERHRCRSQRKLIGLAVTDLQVQG